MTLFPSSSLMSPLLAVDSFSTWMMTEFFRLHISSSSSQPPAFLSVSAEVHSSLQSHPTFYYHLQMRRVYSIHVILSVGTMFISSNSFSHASTQSLSLSPIFVYFRRHHKSRIQDGETVAVNIVLQVAEHAQQHRITVKFTRLYSCFRDHALWLSYCKLHSWLTFRSIQFTLPDWSSSRRMHIVIRSCKWKCRWFSIFHLIFRAGNWDNGWIQVPSVPFQLD